MESTTYTDATIAATESPAPEFVVLYGISPDMYRGILDALQEHRLRHTYDRGTLEMRRILYGVAPEDYLKLMAALAEYPLRHTYDGWTLEIMSPRKDHEWAAGLLGRLIEAMTFALDIPIQTVGSTTLCTSRGDRGVQPDRAYYIAHEPQVRGKDAYDPAHDPPPDLAVEVDVTHSSVSRLPLYAQFGVPEVWRFAADSLRFYQLGPNGQYDVVERSLAFPFLKPADVTRFVVMRHDVDEHSIIRRFVDWALQASRKSLPGT